MTEIDYETRREIFKQSLEKHGIERCVIVTGSFRAGTSFICSLLSANGIPSAGHEKFRDFYEFWRPRSDAEWRENLDEIFATSQDGLFACKLMWPHRNGLFVALGHQREDAQLSAAVFPNATWINVLRRDKFAQAISFWKAKATERWHIYSDDNEPSVTFNFEDIRSAFIELSGHDLLWKDFHDKAETDACTVIYEEFLSNVHEKLIAILERINGKPSRIETLITTSTLRQQRNQQSEEFYRLFLEHYYKTGY